MSGGYRRDRDEQFRQGMERFVSRGGEDEFDRELDEIQDGLDDIEEEEPPRERGTVVSLILATLAALFLLGLGTLLLADTDSEQLLGGHVAFGAMVAWLGVCWGTDWM